MGGRRWMVAALAVVAACTADAGGLGSSASGDLGSEGMSAPADMTDDGPGDDAAATSAGPTSAGTSGGPAPPPPVTTSTTDPPDGEPCEGDEDCVDSPGTPHCDTGVGRCEECVLDAHCTEADGRCDPEDHVCVQCLTAAECPVDLPVCDEQSHECRPCSDAAECEQGVCLGGRCTTTYGQACSDSTACDQDAGEGCCLNDDFCEGICVVPCPNDDETMCPPGTGCNHDVCYPLCNDDDADCDEYAEHLSCFHQRYCEA